MSTASRITVCIRKRPLNRQETKRGDGDILVESGRSSLQVHEPKVKYDLTKYTEKHSFVFDLVANEQVDTASLYDTAAKPLLDTCMSGGFATCFAYGQTGSGKTFTMMGGGEQPGIYVLAAQDLFSMIDPSQHHVQASFFEIYAGKLYDLTNRRNKLFALVDAKDNLNINGLMQHPVKNVQGLMSLIDVGLKERASGATAANADSSRSHAILQLSVKHVRNDKQFGKLCFIDLAGNERGADTAHCDRQTRTEGAEINKSLLALKECIRALALGSKHVPFRGSKLTLVLKDSFTGKSRAVMIANVSPASGNCEHTLNTLRYAYRVKELKEPSKGGGGGGANPFPVAIDAMPAEAVEPVAVEAAPVLPPKRKPRSQWNADPSAMPITVQHTIQAVRDDPEDYPEDDEEAEAPAGEGDDELSGMIAAHNQLMCSIVDEEEDVLAFHRAHIDAKMDLVKAELQEMETMDRGKMSVDDYVTRVDDVLAQQVQRINELRDRLAQFQGHLLEEEILNTTVLSKRR